MSIKDRTGEFRATVDSFSPTTDPIVRRRTPTNDSAIAKHSEFMQQASKISSDIHLVCGQLERLTKTTRSRTSLLDDHKQAEYIELATVIETGIQRINQELGLLRQHQRDQPEQQHSGGVIASLQSRLADATRTLAQVLQERERVEQEQRARRDRYSAGIKLPDNLSINRVSGDRQPSVSSDRSQLLDSTAMSYQQLALVQSTDTSYLEARSAAVQGIEKSIHEIGQVFSQLTRLIAEQGETVQRIDANIDTVSFNIDRGHVELLKYYNYVASNRWLLLKMFVVLVVFMLLFNALFL